MSVVVRFEGDGGQGLLVEVDDDAYGVAKVSRGGDAMIEAGQRLDEVLAQTRPTIRAVVEAIRDLAPDEHEIEFGLKLNAEAGVIVAKTAMEGHFTMKLTWRRPSTPSPDGSRGTDAPTTPPVPPRVSQ
ncbi:MAG: CU044_2847 family protein [Pseudonocardiaceae bacterium]